MSNHRNHTPGPWHVAPEGPGDDLRVAVGAGEAIAHINVIGREDIANARLIAAAPDLLAVLEKHVEWVERDKVGAIDHEWDYETMVGQYIRAAIAKAKGG